MRHILDNNNNKKKKGVIYRVPDDSCEEHAFSLRQRQAVDSRGRTEG